MKLSSSLTQLINLIKQGHVSYGIATSIMLTWLMKTDGRTSKEESRILDNYLTQFNLQSYRSLFEEIINNFDLQSIEFASEILRRELTNEGKRLTMDLLLGMIIADGYITYTEMYVIEFIADLFEISPSELDNIFKESTGRPKVKHGDPSSADWWEKREGQSQSNNRQENRERDYNQSNQKQSISKRQKALAILGLDENATQKEIKDSFRLLTKIHHPDRYHRLGEEAKKTANQTYIRIKDAYEYLMAS